MTTATPFTMESCGCYATDTPGGRCIVYCPTHDAAPEMLAFVDSISDQACARYAGKRPWYDSCDCKPCEARALLAKIDGYVLDHVRY